MINFTNQKEFDTICTTQIYGKDVSSDPQDGVKFEFSKTVAMNEQYDTYNKVANKVHERLKDLTAELAKTKKDKPGCLLITSLRWKHYFS